MLQRNDNTQDRNQILVTLLTTVNKEKLSEHRHTNTQLHLTPSSTRDDENTKQVIEGKLVFS